MPCSRVIRKKLPKIPFLVYYRYFEKKERKIWQYFWSLRANLVVGTKFRVDAKILSKFPVFSDYNGSQFLTGILEKPEILRALLKSTHKDGYLRQVDAKTLRNYRLFLDLSVFQRIPVFLILFQENRPTLEFDSKPVRRHGPHFIYKNKVSNR